MLTRNYSDYQCSSNFDAIQFEQKREEAFNQTEKPCFETQYEVDSKQDWYGEIFRVWNGKSLIGTFHKSCEKWITDSYYLNRQYQKLDKCQRKICLTYQNAVKHIICCYEGKR